MSSAHRSDLTHEVNILGFHFESSVVERACFELGVVLTESGRVAQSSLAALNEDPRRKPQPRVGGKRHSGAAFDLSLPQETIDEHAELAITDLFPNIPRPDLEAVIRRAFQKVRQSVDNLWRRSPLTKL